MEIDDYHCDLEIQKFLRSRWTTRRGEEALKKILIGIKNSSEIRGILDDYILEHPWTYGKPA